MNPLRLALLLAALALAGCGTAIDEGEAKACRLILPALEPDGSRITITRLKPGAQPRSVFMRYRVERAGARTLQHLVMCRFAETPGAGKPDLVGVATQHGRLNGARLYLLKRFYLATPDAEANDPGPGEPEPGD